MVVVQPLDLLLFGDDVGASERDLGVYEMPHLAREMEEVALLRLVGGWFRLWLWWRGLVRRSFVPELVEEDARPLAWIFSSSRHLSGFECRLASLFV